MGGPVDAHTGQLGVATAIGHCLFVLWMLNFVSVTLLRARWEVGAEEGGRRRRRRARRRGGEGLPRPHLVLVNT